MKMKQLVTSAALFVAIALATPSAFAVTAAQKVEIKKAITSVPVPEMPAKAADLVLKASKEDRSDVAGLAVKYAIYRSRTSAPQVVAAVSKAAPEVAGVASMTAVQLEGDQAGLIAQAATTAAPGAKTEIVSSVRSGLMSGSGMTVASGPLQYTSGLSSGSFSSSSDSLITRGSFGGVPTGGVTSTNKPINQTSGGQGNGTFGSTPPTSAGPGTVIDYTKPRTP
jgi:hypothetical protein